MFQEEILKWYAKHRRDLPWRRNVTPYKVLVSEMMLQQTQVARVIPKYRAFLREFPNIKALARAPLGQVLTCWSGLGYNRRAKFLHAAAKQIVENYKGRFPRDSALLRTLPGIGEYSAAAIQAFAYDEPAILIETNIRTVIIHQFFSGSTRKKITDEQIRSLLQQSRPAPSKIGSREWYYALMDYGSFLKSQGISLNRKTVNYQVQSRFKGSCRAVRGAILKAVVSGQKVTADTLKASFPERQSQINKIIQEMVLEGLIRKVRRNLVLV